jgi:hypothetical protein
MGLKELLEFFLLDTIFVAMSQSGGAVFLPKSLIFE